MDKHGLSDIAKVGLGAQEKYAPSVDRSYTSRLSSSSAITLCVKNGLLTDVNHATQRKAQWKFVIVNLRNVDIRDCRNPCNFSLSVRGPILNQIPTRSAGRKVCQFKDIIVIKKSYTAI
jgi:hypothetical protein